MFDTLGSILALIGLILGICSLILDQYDLEFELEGQLKTLKDQMNTFHTNFKNEIVSIMSFWSLKHARQLVRRVSAALVLGG